MFERLGIKPNFVYIEQRIAMEKMRAGEIDAVIAVGGKPYKSVSRVQRQPLPSGPGGLRKAAAGRLSAGRRLTAKDYPNLIAEGERVDTIAVPAVLAAYNWAPNTDRYRKLAQFVDAFFTKFPTFQNPPFHPKWKEVSLSAPLPDWQRLPAAEQWLKSHNVEAVTRARFDEFLKQSPATAATVKTDTDKEALFKQFQSWEAEQNARGRRLACRRSGKGYGVFSAELGIRASGLDLVRPEALCYSDTSAVVDPALQRRAGGIAMLLRDVACDHANGGGQDSGIVGKSEHRQHVRHEIERQDEVGDGAKQRRLHVARRLLVEGAVVGREQVLGEGKLGHHLFQLDPETPAHALAVFREPVGRLKTHGVIGRCHRSDSLGSGAADRRGVHASFKNWGCPATAARSRRHSGAPNWRAIAFMALARSISSLVTPPASWVASTTSTVL